MTGQAPGSQGTVRACTTHPGQLGVSSPIRHCTQSLLTYVAGPHVRESSLKAESLIGKK